MVKPKIVFVDWHKTLSNSNFFWQLKCSGDIDEDFLYDSIKDCIFNKNSKIVRPWMTGEITSECMFEKVSFDLNLNYKILFDQFVYSCQTAKLISPNTNQLVQKLRRNGAKVYIATDNMDSFNRWTVPSLKIQDIFDGVINSFDVKAYKQEFEGGQSLFFREILEKENLKPNEAILFDDSEDKDNRLAKYGINYIRIDEENNLEKNLLKLLGEGDDDGSESH